jgi:ketosteroid isomerase-like protein
MSSATLLEPLISASPRKSTTSPDEAALLALVEALRVAHHDKSAAGIAAPYTQNAVLFDLAPPLAHSGIDREGKQAWLDSWETSIELETRDLELTICGDVAFGHGFLRMQGRKKGAENPVDFWMRATYCFERVRGAWRIVHEHTSVPFYMDGSLRPAFDLRP